MWPKRLCNFVATLLRTMLYGPYDMVNVLYTRPGYLYDDWMVGCTSWLTLVILKYYSDFNLDIISCEFLICHKNYIRHNF